MAKRFDPKARAKKQKILLAVLGVVLLGVLAYQAPTILSVFGGGSSEVASEPAPPAPVPVSPAPATPAPAGSAQLVDSDVAPAAAEGQLVSFDRFESKDPFAQQAEEQAAPGAPAAKPSGPAKGAGRLPEDNVPSVPLPRAPSPAPAALVATITVNGASSEVRVGGAFPEAEPVFRLVSLKKSSAKVGIVDGTYASGSETITLKKGGKPVTLMNTAEGTTYVLRLVSVK
jgi:hypothetical protein